MYWKILLLVFASFTCNSIENKTEKPKLGTFKTRFFYNSFPDPPMTPWLGVLRVRQYGSERDAVTGIVAITTHHALGVAYAVAMIDKFDIRTRAQALFYNTFIIPSYAAVSDFILHPEYPDITLNTIALVFMDPDFYDATTMWNPIAWPSFPYNGQGHLTAVGYTDARGDFDQISYVLVNISQSTCSEFYENGLQATSPILRPVHYLCTKDAKKRETNCTYDAGMTLATNISGQWILVGISTHGPGCTNPSRFILFYPYMEWIRKELDKHPTDERSSLEVPLKITTFRPDGRRRRDTTTEPTTTTERTTTPTTIVYDFVDDPLEDRDTRFFLQQLNMGIELQKLKWYFDPKWTEKRLNCSVKEGVHSVVYAEKGFIKTPHTEVNATYTVSAYDFYYLNVQCIRITVNCTSRTLAHISFGEGFEQEDLEFFIKTVPIKTADNKIPPKIIYLKEGWRKYKDVRMVHITFKFTFMSYGSLHVIGYGREKIVTDRPHDTTTLPPERTTTRKKRTYPHFIRYTKTWPPYRYDPSKPDRVNTISPLFRQGQQWQPNKTLDARSPGDDSTRYLPWNTHRINERR